MSRLIDKRLTAAQYEQAASEYYQTLPLEHFMEGIDQSTQREIALESLALLKTRRPELQVFSELLVQYYHEDVLRRVVPDNMVRLHDRPPVTKGSFNTELEPVGPLWVLEWVSTDKDKDYKESFHKYEQELHVPYCLLYHPETGDLRVFRHTGTHYEPIAVNAQGRQTIPELDLEIGLWEGWVRFWHKGELLGLPADLQNEIDRLQSQLAREQQLRAAAESEVQRLRAFLAQKPSAPNGP